MGEWFNIYLNDSDKELLKQTIKMRIDKLGILIDNATNNFVMVTYATEKSQLYNLYLRIQDIKDQGQYMEES